MYSKRVVSLVKNRGIMYLLPYLLDFLRGILHGYPGVLVGAKVTLKNKRQIKIGRFTRIESHVELDGFGTSGIVIGEGCKIGKYSILRVPPVPTVRGIGINIGDHTSFAEFCFVGGAGLVNIGSGNSFGQYVSIHPQNHKGGDRHLGVIATGIHIGDNNWFGAKSSVLDGVVIGDNNVVGAVTLLNKKFGSNARIVGVPGVVR